MNDSTPLNPLSPLTPLEQMQQRMEPYSAACTDFSNTDTIYKKQLKTITLKVRAKQRPSADKVGEPISIAGQVYDLLEAVFAKLDDDQEHLILLVMNNGNVPTGYKLIASGARDSLTVDARIIFRNALLLGAESIILVHNHPSDNPKPSDDDIAMTKRLVTLGAALTIPLIDHIIVSPYLGNYYGMARWMPSLFTLNESLPDRAGIRTERFLARQREEKS